MSDTSYNCPSCGAPVKFQSAVAVLAQCAHCHKGLVRHDLKLEAIGDEAILQADMSPFQPGTAGVYEGKAFTLLGRLKVQYDLGTWSEWYALFDDGTVGWLAEAQGLYMMSFERASNITYPPSVRVGMEFKWEGVTYVVDDIRYIHYVGFQGELPFTYNRSYQAMSLDFRSADGKFASATINGQDGLTFYAGKYLPFSDFKFTNLRQIDGWDEL